MSFVEPAQKYLSKKLTIRDNEIRAGWGKYAPRDHSVQVALENGGSRNVYLGNLDNQDTTEDSLRKDLAKYGTIEHVRIVPEKNIAFVHCTSVAQATKCVVNLPLAPAWFKRKVNYGKDRCWYKGDQLQQIQPVQQPQQ